MIETEKTPVFFGTPGDAACSWIEYKHHGENAKKMPFERLESIVTNYRRELNNQNLINRGLHWLGSHIWPNLLTTAYENTYDYRKQTESQALASDATDTSCRKENIAENDGTSDFCSVRHKGPSFIIQYEVYKEQLLAVPIENIKAYLDGRNSIYDKNCFTKTISKIFTGFDPNLAALKDAYQSRTTGDIHGHE